MGDDVQMIEKEKEGRQMNFHEDDDERDDKKEEERIMTAESMDWFSDDTQLGLETQFHDDGQELWTEMTRSQRDYLNETPDADYFLLLK